ncbi:MAG: hypothetical protein K0R24_2311 [Gammaproteobacteria bacterium]|nr:hypothetical protein [Gammaproteobacteria bacterium]
MPWKEVTKMKSKLEFVRFALEGHFAMHKGRCHPLTVIDDHSRFSIGLRA